MSQAQPDHDTDTARSSPDGAMAAARDWLTRAQDPEGFWVGILESNCCMEAEWLLAFHVMDYDYPHAESLVQSILDRQRADGAWETYLDAPAGDINATVECYAALRVRGLSPQHDALRRAREWIFRHGGLGGIRVFTRYWLALIGEWPWEHTPNLPPEVIRQPLWSPFNIYRFASWARATLVPLAVLSARRHVRYPRVDRRLDELFPDGRGAIDYRLMRRGTRWSWQRFFIGVDRVLHGLQSLRLTPGRKAAVARCLEWVVRHQDADGSWGGIQPPWIYSLMALHVEGYATDHPVMRRGLEALETHWAWQRGGTWRIQASESSVWDTLLAMTALLDSGASVADEPSLTPALDWILAHENRSRGDWSQRLPHVEPGGWAFERANRHYPDVDDTAVAVTVLARVRSQLPNPERVAEPLERAVDWLLAMQSENGGWGAFDRDNNSEWLTRIPFCDFGEALDPPSADVTAHVVEALGTLDRVRYAEPIERAVAFLRREQETSGSWFGRWGVNHLYGTGAVLPALAASGEPMNAPWVTRAAEWLIACQNDDGGWGESCASYMDSAWVGRGPSVPSQTAWAMLGLLAVSPREYRVPLSRGADWLARHQVEGTWSESAYTGTGFPGYGVGARVALDQSGLSADLQQGIELQRGFMINYNLYRHYFPLMALGRYRASLG